MFTPKLAVAVRVLNLLRKGGMRGWVSARDLQKLHGIDDRTLRALLRRGVVLVRVNHRMRNGETIGVECRLAPKTLAIIDAVRA
jgi:hypothetical protein